MKKKLALLLCVVLTLGLFVGCKGDKPINTVDTSNTSDTSSKIETETIIDDIYANRNINFSQYTLEEFKQLDISDEYVMISVSSENEFDLHRALVNSGIKGRYTRYLTYLNKQETKLEYNFLVELESKGKQQVLTAIKEFEKIGLADSIRPMGFKIIPVDSFKNTDKKQHDIYDTPLKKPYSEYTEQENEEYMNRSGFTITVDLCYYDYFIIQEKFLPNSAESYDVHKEITDNSKKIYVYISISGETTYSEKMNMLKELEQHPGVLHINPAPQIIFPD